MIKRFPSPPKALKSGVKSLESQPKRNIWKVEPDIVSHWVSSKRSLPFTYESKLKNVHQRKLSFCMANTLLYFFSMAFFLIMFLWCYVFLLFCNIISPLSSLSYSVMWMATLNAKPLLENATSVFLRYQVLPQYPSGYIVYQYCVSVLSFNFFRSFPLSFSLSFLLKLPFLFSEKHVYFFQRNWRIFCWILTSICKVIIFSIGL